MARQILASLARVALGGAAAVALLVLAPPSADAADRSVGRTQVYSCDYKPGGMCTCEGGHNEDSCQKLKESGLCKNPKDGSTVMCCEGSVCRCRIGGQEDTQCPAGSERKSFKPGLVPGRRGPGAQPIEAPVEGESQMKIPQAPAPAGKPAEAR